jgi:thioredoxin-like negative regulator of GroEL
MLTPSSESDITVPSPSGPMARRHLDFLYWHAVSKMRMAEFQGASSIFRLISRASPTRHDAALGLAYCLVRLGELDDAAGLVARLRRDALPSREMRLLGRLHRRCEFERSRRVSRERQLQQRVGANVNLPHTLGDDGMARRALEATLQTASAPGLNG